MKAEHPIFERMFLYQSGGYPIDKAIIIKGDGGDPCVCAFFADLDLDVFRVDFYPDDEIQLRADGVTHITVTPHLLRRVANTYRAALRLMDALDAYWDADEDGWVGWEHLITQPSPLGSGQVGRDDG